MFRQRQAASRSWGALECLPSSLCLAGLMLGCLQVGAYFKLKERSSRSDVL